VIVEVIHVIMSRACGVEWVLQSTN